VNNILPIKELKDLFSLERVDDLSYVDGIRAKLSNAFLMFLSFLLVPALASLIYRGIDVGWQSVQISTLVILVLWWGVAVARKRLSHRIRSIAAIACMYIGSTSGLLSLGLLSMAIPGYLACSILAAIFLGVEKSLYVIAICILSILIVGYGITTGALQISVDAVVFNTSTGAWTAAAIFFAAIVGSLVLCFAGLMGALLTLVSKVREQGAELMLRHDQLEELVTDRTQELTKEIEVRKERELALTASEERFKGFTEVVSDRYWETDENFVIIYAPPTFQATLEFGVDVVGKKAWEIDLVLLGNDRDKLRSTLENKKEFRDLKLCWQMPNGQKIFRRLSGIPMRNAMGKFKGFRVIGVDETAEIVAQEEAQAIQTRFFESLNQFNIGVVLWDPEEKIQYCSKAMKWLYPQCQDLFEVGLKRTTLREASWKYRVEIGDTSKSKDEWLEESHSGNFLDTMRRPGNTPSN
jgi:PAS domain-containing protein